MVVDAEIEQRRIASTSTSSSSSSWPALRLEARAPSLAVDLYCRCCNAVCFFERTIFCHSRSRIVVFVISSSSFFFFSQRNENNIIRRCFCRQSFATFVQILLDVQVMNSILPFFVSFRLIIAHCVADAHAAANATTSTTPIALSAMDTIDDEHQQV